MPLGKRKYSSYMGGARTGRLQKRYQGAAVKKVRSAPMTRFGANIARLLSRRVSRVERTIETKEGVRALSGTNLALAHNNIVVLNSTLLYTQNGTEDPMGSANGQRIGDQITLKGVAINLFLQNQAQRPRVFYRVMVVKSAKGDTPTRATLFKGMTGNKMIDQMNTERYTILAQQRFTVTAQGSMAWTTASVPAGVPQTDNGATAIGGVGTKICKMWIPGRKFARNSVVKYENQGNQPKFFDFHLIIMAYDWFGTPQDVNNVGAVSDGWIKLYFKDA